MSQSTKRARGPSKRLDDVYCRGCHSRPSYKNINTYFCVQCWELWNKLRRSSLNLGASEVPKFAAELNAFVKERGRYVWHPEAYLFFRAIPTAVLKNYNIEVSTVCRDLGFYAPSDDRITVELSRRVEDYVLTFWNEHRRTPEVRETLKVLKLDHATLWSIDYAAIIARLGGKIPINARHRFRSSAEFRQAAAQVVRDADCPLHLTCIFEELGICYPTYRGNFADVTSEEIHDLAGVERSRRGLASLFEVAAEKALTQLGFEVERQPYFPGLIGNGNRHLHYDFRLGGTRILVEIDGPQHYNVLDTYHKPNAKKYDAMKESYALRHGYPLIRVDARIYKHPKAMETFLRPQIEALLGKFSE